MASLVLTAVGNAVAGPIGAIVGGVAGRFIDAAVFSPKSATAPSVVEGPRLSNLHVTTASEGAAIPRLVGRMRVSPQMIWATHFREVVRKETTQTPQSGGGGKGSSGAGGGGGSQTQTTKTYHYYISFALGLCEGPIVDIGQVWADGKPLNMPNYNWRLYKGDEAQEADPKIAAVEGADRVPGFRGLAYLVFEQLPIERFGNRIPQITVEVIRRPASVAGTPLEDGLRGVSLIPTLGEFIYATDTVYRDAGFGQTEAENRHGNAGRADIVLSLDQLESGAQNVETVSLVVGWHGTDLSCGSCQILPKVEIDEKENKPWSWQVSGTDRDEAVRVSRDSFGPLLGGAPSDRSVYQAIVELKSRGFKVMLHPFIMMDIPAGNEKPNPYSDNAAELGQSPFPWRGRITCSPAAGYDGTVDKTQDAAGQIATFFGTAAAAHFGAWDDGTIPYSGPNEWSFRRFILHFAKLCVAAGGVDAFMLGSELVGLTTVRSDSSFYPAVAALAQLADDVKAIVGAQCKVGYGADWSEYANHRPSDGSGDVFFHLDPLWSRASIDFVGIDYYMPLADWREGSFHHDAQAGASAIYDQSYLQGNIEGGELYDWYYASQADREQQARSDITDNAFGEPWVHRIKDLRSWWRNAHHNRPGGIRHGVSTAWIPQSKPIFFTELGCAAVDKGANQPNVFVDAKSAESALPHFSNGRQDALVQRAYLEALLTYWSPASGNNPSSTAYDGRMINNAFMCVWAWDARPYPQFPRASLVWRDAANYRRGHWLTGRMGTATLADVVAELTSGLGVTVDTSALNGTVKGYLIDAVMSPRSALSPLQQLFFFDAVESSGVIKFVHRGGAPVATFKPGDLVRGGTELYALTRAQETELPRTAHLQFIDPENGYNTASVYARRLAGASDRTIEVRAAVALDYAEAQGISEVVLHDVWLGRETADAVLPPSAYALEPTDVIRLDLGDRELDMRLGEIGFAPSRAAKLIRTDAATYGAVDGPDRGQQPNDPDEPGPAALYFLDLPMLVSNENPGAPRLAAYADPWARVSTFHSPSGAGFTLDSVLENRACIGETRFDFYSGPLWRFDTLNDLYVRVPANEEMISLDDLSVFAGGNACAIENADGDWEVIQFATAELEAPGEYKLSRLLRGQLGTEHAMRDPVAAGARFVLLDDRVIQTAIGAETRGLALNWRWGPSTHTLDDDTYQGAVLTHDAVGLRPFSPVHLHAQWENDGDIHMSWIRRSRIGSDSWEQPEVPIGESQELYEVEILNGDGDVVRTITGLGAPAYLYDVATQITDFGAPLTSMRYRVYQVSGIYGRSKPAEYP